MSSKSAFDGDTDFCSECGAILPLPGEQSSVTCRVCGYSIDVKKFDGITTVSRIFFNDRDQLLKQRQKKETAAPAGPLVDRECRKCHHKGMTYATLQTRSADEGQTVFYTCPQCQYQENENS